MLLVAAATPIKRGRVVFTLGVPFYCYCFLSGSSPLLSFHQVILGFCSELLKIAPSVCVW